MRLCVHMSGGVQPCANGGEVLLLAFQGRTPVCSTARGDMAVAALTHEKEQAPLLPVRSSYSSLPMQWSRIGRCFGKAGRRPSHQRMPSRARLKSNPPELCLW